MLRYAKLKLVAIKLKKKTLEQEKQIRELQDKASAAPASSSSSSSNESSKFATLMANFERLQLQNDEQV